MRLMPRVKDYMTPQPYSVQDQTSIAEAEQTMRRYNVRHLPVVVGDKVVGIVSDRDLKSVGSLKASPETLAVKFILHEHPYTVNPNTPIDEVAKQMAQHHYGSAIIVEDNKLVGIFTTVDACRALAEVLEKYMMDPE